MGAVLNVWLESGETEFVFRTGYNERLLGRLRALQGRRWDGTRKVWLVPARHSAEVGAIVSEFRLLADDSAAARWDSGRRTLVESEAASGATASGFTVAGLARTLRPFQAAGVEYATGKQRVLIADSMGLGKTCQAIATVHHLGTYPALVICPAVMKETWRREILAWLPGAEVEVLSGTKPPRLFQPRARWLVCNFDVIHAWGPALATPAALIVDESHYVKEWGSRRTRAVLQLAARMRPDSVRLCLTGTPVVNRPAELAPQLAILGRLDEFGGRARFEDDFCGRRVEHVRLPGGRTRRITRVDGATNLAILNTLLRQRCFVRRQKEDVLAELPPKVRSVHWGDAPATVYALEERQIVEELRDKARQLAGSMGVSVEALTEAEEFTGFCADALGALAKLRRALARAKVPMVQAVAEEMLETPGKLVIFGHHRDLTEALAEHFACPRVLGGMAERDRQAAVDAFQAPGGPRVIVCSIQAAGIGLTLTAASDVLMTELAWTPAALDQAEDRLHRIGQRGSVTAWYTLVPGTIDERMWELLEAKRAVTGAVTDGAMQRELVKRLVTEASVA